MNTQVPTTRFKKQTIATLSHSLPFHSLILLLFSLSPWISATLNFLFIISLFFFVVLPHMNIFINNKLFIFACFRTLYKQNHIVPFSCDLLLKFFPQHTGLWSSSMLIYVTVIYFHSCITFHLWINYNLTVLLLVHGFLSYQYFAI